MKGFLIVTGGGTGGGAASAIESRLTAEAIPHAIVASDLAHEPQTSLYLPMVKWVMPLLESPGDFGPLAKHFVAEHSAYLRKEVLGEGGGAFRRLTQLALVCNRDAVLAELGQAVYSTVRQGADEIQVVVVGSTGGSVGSTVLIEVPRLLADPAFRSRVEGGYAGVLVQGAIVFALDPWGRVREATHKDDAGAYKALKIQGNMFQWRLDFVRASLEGAISYGFLTGLGNAGGGVHLEDAGDAERYLGLQVAAFLSSFEQIRGSFVNDAFDLFAETWPGAMNQEALGS